MSIDYSQEEAQAPLITTTLTKDDEGEGSLRPRSLTEYIPWTTSCSTALRAWGRPPCPASSPTRWG